ncbi:MAG: hypothetical protein WCJ57_03105 [Candidatus Falkowbacteria bacterium]
MSTLFSIGAMNQLADAFEKAGFSAEDVTKLKQFNNLKGVKAIINGRATITYPERLIDLAANPFCPEGWSVEEHQGTGNWKLDLSAPLHWSKKQVKGTIEGNKLRKELKGKKVLNANVLDYLLTSPDLIPEEWKNKNVFFWGTIYNHSDDSLYVRYLRWYGSSWGWYYHWLDFDFDSAGPAVVAS